MSNQLRGMARQSKQKGKPLKAWKELVLFVHTQLQEQSSDNVEKDESIVTVLEAIQLTMANLEDKYNIT